jgi:hypothetical protein
MDPYGIIIGTMAGKNNCWYVVSPTDIKWLCFGAK